MIGLIKSTHYYSKQAALADNAFVARLAFTAGYAIPAIPLRAGHKSIDKATEKMLKLLNLNWEQVRQLKQTA